MHSKRMIVSLSIVQLGLKFNIVGSNAINCDNKLIQYKYKFRLSNRNFQND